jgi:phosphoglycerate kinase
MAKKTIRDLPKDLTGKKVLVRLDLNVAIDEATGEIRNDRRIRASLPTLQDLLGRGAAVIAMSHLGRPKPGADAKKNAPFTMDRVAKRVGEQLGRTVMKANDVVGDDAKRQSAALNAGEILLLENVRFHPYEQPLKKDDATEPEKAAHEAGMKKLAADLAAMGNIYVNDAFGTLQNKDVSVLALPKAMASKPRVIGLLIEKELATIDRLLDKAERPMIGIMGGAKVSDKIKFIEVLLTKVDKLLIGGKLAYTFLKASNVPVGAMQVDYKDEELVKGLHAELWPKCQRPEDYLVAHKDDVADTKIATGPVPPDYAGVDIGPKTIEIYCREIAKAKTVIWNGPVGWFEKPPFDKGTRAIAEACAKLAQSGGTVVVGGGETAEAVEEFGLADKMTHVSTGGGAFLKYVEDRGFKTLDALEDR